MMKEHTPVMRHYLSLKGQYPDALLMYQMGDFYEFFFEDAQIAADILHIALTARGDHGTEKIKMAGVPVHTKDAYITKLVQAGCTVVICSQQGNSQTSKGPIQRDITQIITPGTLTDPQLLDDKQNATLLVLIPQPTHAWGLAWTSLTTGTISFRALDPTEWPHFLSRIRPTEIITNTIGLTHIPAGYCAREAPAHLFTRTLEQGLTHIPDYTVHRLFGQHTHPAAPALALLLAYAEETQRHPPSFITHIEEEPADRYLSIDAHTRHHLDIDSANTHRHTLYQLLDQCYTKGGSRHLRHRLHHPFRQTHQGREQHEAIAYVIAHILPKKDSQRIRSAMRSLKDIERIATRIALGSVKPHELGALRHTLHIIQNIQELLSPLITPDISSLHTLCRGLTVPEALLRQLTTALADEDTLLTATIASGYHEPLDQLRSAYDTCHRALLAIEDTEKQQTGLSTLRIQFNRVHGYYIELSSGAAKQVPARYQRIQSLKNVERFTIPALKEQEKEIMALRSSIQALEQDLYNTIVTELTGYVEPLRHIAQHLAHWDLIFSHAAFAQQYRYVQPTLTHTHEISIVQGRHPIVEAHHPDFIPNDIESESQQPFTLITGPNMGGKSTYMRQTALIVLLSYCGLFVPADSARIGPIDAIFTRIGASDDITAGHSTFMVEMIESAHILQRATPASLVIMDEIGRGTSTFDGISLAYAIARMLIQRGCHTLFSTHYQELSRALHDCPACQHRYFDATIYADKLLFSHRVRPGSSEQSYGIHVARLAGLPTEALHYAERFLQTLQKTVLHT